MATRKSYRQACPVSMALDVVGDRWTLLLLRELLGGPGRFGELIEGLPGVPRNLLATRLRRLEEDGVVQHSSRGTYALTEVGEGVRSAIEALGFWGARVGPVEPVEHPRSVRAMAMALQAVLVHGGGEHPAAPRTMELQVGEEAVEIVLGPHPRATVREPVGAAVPLRTTKEAVSGFLDGQGLRGAQIEGPPDAAAELLKALGAS